MKKRNLVHEFAILTLLAFAIGVIVLQAHFNFTGYAVLSNYTNQTDCESSGYFWYNNTCNSDALVQVNSTTNSTLTNSTTNSTLTDLTNSTTNSTLTNSTTNSTTNSSTCTENWSCTDWTDCADGSQTRTCNDANSCGTTADEPSLSQTCTVACTENWVCTDWSDCNDGTKTRTCNDANSCGTTVYQPSLLHECTSAPTTDTSQTSAASATSNVVQTSTCTPSWTCGDWQECVNGTQLRVCTDVNNCGTQDGMPEASQACTPVLSNNQTAQQKKGFFSLVGSVVQGPIHAVGNFFNNKTNIFIFSGAVIALVLGFFTFRFFSKHDISITSKKSPSIYPSTPVLDPPSD